jgi:sugar lactone lactonase YvrE
MAFAILLLVVTIDSVNARANDAPPVTPLYAGIGVHDSTPLTNPLGIHFDAIRRECYVADTGNGQVVVFNDNGMPVYRFPHLVPGPGGELKPGEPKSVATDGTGAIYLVDNQVPYIDVLDPRGRSIRQIHVPGDECGQPERFTHLAPGPDRVVYAVTACKVPRVMAIGENGAIARTVELQHPGAERSCVSGFALDRDGRIYVTNQCATLMVQIYSPDGELVRAFGKHDTGFENFAFPAGLVVMNNGDLWVVDTIRQVISRFDQEGKLLTMIGGKGSQPGAFEYPSAVATDGESLLFVLERQGGRYQCLRINEGVASTN